MEARHPRLAVMAVLATFISPASVLLAAQHKTANFVVEAATPQIAEQVGQAAEQFRHDLAVHWLGEPLPKNWSRPCPISVKVGPNLGAGGATSFLFDRGEVYGWRMNIQGTLERVLDSVLPHEVTHTIFASYFRQPLPRWADEGACTTVEHVSERTNHQKHLQQFLRTGRGIPFSRMFEMKDYPQDVMPLYAQGHSVVTFLMQHGGQSKFIRFVREGLKSEQWVEVTHRHYGFASLAALQDAWLDWVRRGSPESPQTTPQPESTILASNESTGRLPRPEPNLILRGQNESPAAAEKLSDVTVPVPGPEDRRPAAPTKGFAPLARLRGAIDNVLRPRREWEPLSKQTARPEMVRATEAADAKRESRVTDETASSSHADSNDASDATDSPAASDSATRRSGQVLLEWRRKTSQGSPTEDRADERSAPAVSRRAVPLDAAERGRSLLR